MRSERRERRSATTLGRARLDGAGVLCVGGACVGAVEALLVWDPAPPASPGAEALAHFVLVPGLYGLAAAVAGRAVIAAAARLFAVRRGDFPSLALASVGGLIALLHLAAAARDRLGGALLFAATAGSIVSAVVVTAALHGLLVRIPPLRAALAAVDRRAATWLSVAAIAVVTGLAQDGPVRRTIEEWLPPSETKRDRIERVFLIGLDGADWNVLWPLLESGMLPHLGRLAEEGRADFMHVSGPTISPLVWTSIATGVSAVKHGIHDFTIKPAGAYEPIPYQTWHRKVPAVWKIAGDFGRDVLVVNYQVTTPPEPVNGVMVSGVEEIERPPSYPPDALSALEERCFGPRPYPQPEDDPRALAKFLGERLSRVESLTDCLLEDLRPELFVGYTHTTDAAQHLFWKYAFPGDFAPERWTIERDRDLAEVLSRHWQAADRWVGRILERADDSTLVLVVSDHGAKAMTAPFVDVDVEELLEAMGWDADDGSEASAKGGRLAYDASLAPFSEEIAVSLNVEGRERNGVIRPAEADAVVDALVADLSRVVTTDGTPLFREVTDYETVRARRRERFGETTMDVLCRLDRRVRSIRAEGGSVRLRVPALVASGPALERIRGRRRSREISLAAVVDVLPLSGEHRDRGVLIAHGAGIDPGPPPPGLPETRSLRSLKRLAVGPESAGAAELPRPRPVDLTPTILHALGIPVAKDMDGAPLLDLFDPDFVEEHPVRWTESYGSVSSPAGEPTIDEEQLRYLRTLGYVGGTGRESPARPSPTAPPSGR